jgi:hypothetical protein
LFENIEQSAGFIGLYNIYMAHTGKNAENMKKFWYSLVKGKSLIRVKKNKLMSKKEKKAEIAKQEAEEEEMEN